MDITWTSGLSAFWIVPMMICMIFMVAMIFMMFRRGGGCMPFGGGRGHRAGNGDDTPRQILDRRYAGGQITKDQYDAMRRDLKE